MHVLHHSPRLHNAEPGSRFRCAELRYVQGRLQTIHVSLENDIGLSPLSGRARSKDGASRPKGATAEKAVPFSKLPPFDRDAYNRRGRGGRVSA